MSLEPPPGPSPADLSSLEERLLAWQLQEHPDAAHREPADARRVLLGYAPAALVEGAWLASAARVRHTDRELGLACMESIHTEHGYGDEAAHRGNLYRQIWQH